MKTHSTKKRFASKGSAISKAGYKTGIHALPNDVKTRLDEMLLLRYSPEKALSILEKEYPDINLPSKSAVYSYKSKYLTESLTKVRQVSQLAEKLDIEKMNISSLLISHLRRFIAIDLNVLQDRWYRSLDEEKQLGKSQKYTNDLGKIYLEGIKLSMDMLLKLNVNFEVNEKKESSKEPEQYVSDLQKQKRLLLYSKYCYERLQSGDQLSTTELKIAKLFERRGRINMHRLGMVNRD